MNVDYVLGFYFDKAAENVILIRKDRGYPPNIGKWNGLGGKVEPLETGICSAMAREFQEECGIVTDREDWTCFGSLNVADGTLFLLRAQGGGSPETRESEEVAWHSVDNLPEELAESLRWLVPMAQENQVRIRGHVLPGAGA